MAKTYRLDCGELCSFGPGTKWGIRVSEAILEGTPYREIIATAKREGDTLWPGTISRHRKHIIVTGRSQDAVPVPPRIKHKANNIEILEEIIQKGFNNRTNWKPTISDTMKAMDMWFRLTQGNPFDQLLDTLASASIGEEVEETNDEATGTPAEVLGPMFEDEEEQVLVESAG